MPDLETFIPHREAEKHRFCLYCEADLASKNETLTCFQCVPTWSKDMTEEDLGTAEFMEGLALLMAEPSPMIA